MRIPDKVKICGVSFDVVYLDNLNDGNKVLLGETNYDNTTIKLCSSNQSEEGKKMTFIHEVVHVIDNAFQLKLSEEYIESIGRGVFALINDNPDIFNE